MNDVLTLILGGGRGTRLFPLTHMRSKPAVPLAGKYRLIDIPISNCLHAGLERIFVLTQFNSASLNRHIAQTYRLDMFSDGFVEVLAAEQTPDSSAWFQGTADAVRQAARHFKGFDAEYFLILAGDHLYRMDFNELLESHIEGNADITIAAQPVTTDDATQMGILKFDDLGQITGFEEKPTRERLAEIGGSIPKGSIAGGTTHEKPFVASMGIYVFNREVLIEILGEPGVDFGKEIIPKAISTHVVNPYVFRGYWADVGTIDSFYEANIQLTRRGSAVQLLSPALADLHPPAVPAGDARLRQPSRIDDCRRRVLSRPLRDRELGRRHPHEDQPGREHHAIGAARRGLLRGRRGGPRHPARHRPRCRAGSRDRGQERADRRRCPARERIRRAARGRRRLLHSQRHHHRSQRRAGRAWHCRLKRNGHSLILSSRAYYRAPARNSSTATSGKSVNTPSTPSWRNCSNSASGRPL